MPKAKRVTPDAALFGAIVNRLRTDRGWTLTRLGHLLNMNPTHLGVIESGRNIPSIGTMMEMADVFGVPAWELVRELEEGRRERIARRAKARVQKRTEDVAPEGE